MEITGLICSNNVTSTTTELVAMTLHPPHLLCDNYITSSIKKYAVLSHFRGKKAAYFL